MVEVYTHYPEVILLMNYSSDIRDTVNYKEVMKQYGLGPNGGIVTSLNLFSTRFDQVLNFIEKKGSQCQ
jgi:GTPase SAR1 family protein